MTDPRLDLRRPVPRPAGNLFRVTAVVSFLSLPLIWAAFLWLPGLFAGGDDGDWCQDGNACVAPDDGSTNSIDGLYLIVAAACVELAVIGCYLAVAASHRGLGLRARLHGLPTAVAIVVLAVGGFAWLLVAEGTELVGSAGIGILLFAFWLFTPLVLYRVHRADRRAVIPVAIGLAPTAACNAYVALDFLIAALPAVMLVVAIGTVVVVRLRQRQ
ncbi:hypothetical protein OHA18_29320 [Kribbella sp. NBC_00709]|uniref:hypothetical protein n=1 Tax=Kribbella sp. NBC_00709 TaxID=2975972 RepID=UPI002E28C2FC|nr:hypothetical protein [Kribbella sp. NBC_00709]